MNWRIMSAKPTTLADLRRAGTIGSLEFVAAIDAYMLDPTASPYCFASGHSLDLQPLIALRVGRAEFFGHFSPQEEAFRAKVAEIVMAAHPSPP